jgi:Cu2+-exporting ATPase
LPVPAGLVQPGAQDQFCCNGCRTVYQMIHGCGLDRFYRLRDGADAPAVQARTTDRRYAEYDADVFRDLYTQPQPDGSCRTELYLEGVHCAACVWLVEKLPQVLPGVLEARLDIRRSLVRLRWDDGQVPLSQIARMLDSLGYPPHPARDVHARQLRQQEDRRFLIRIGVAAACAGNVMTLAFALYGGVFTGIEAEYSQLFRWASMLFGLIALLWPGSLFFRGAWAAVRTRTAHLDLPIALGLLAGGVAGTINAVLDRGEIYFDSLTMLVFLLLVGRWIQRRQQRWAGDAVELLFSLTPTSARRLEDDGVIAEVPIEAIGPGDVVEVRAGDTIPTDGVVQTGRSAIDSSLLTGESKPLTVAVGDNVHAGTVNVGSRLRIEVQAVGAQTRVGRLMQLVEECSRRKAPIVQFADRVAGWFVLVVLALAALTLGLWLWLDPSRSVDNAVALLIVTCPCALGLATPLAVTVALGRAARRGILIKGGAALEQLAGRGMMVLDKTGTITAGRTAVVSWDGDADARPWVAALEVHSSHPIARALVAWCAEHESGCRDERFTADDVRQTMGGGLVGSVAGHCVVVGSPQFVREQSVDVDAQLARAQRAVIASGATPVLVGVDGRCTAVIGLGDPIGDDVPQALDRLRRLGWTVRILSGDHPDVVAAVGNRLGVPSEQAIGGASPEDKLDLVRDWGAAGSVVMVGDGVNDAAALSAADVGIAVHGGAEASLAAADVYLSRAGLAPVVELIGAAQATVRVIHRSLAASVCYNAIAATLAMAGLISPLAAAVLMPISSFTVLTLAYSSRTFGSRR